MLRNSIGVDRKHTHGSLIVHNIWDLVLSFPYLLNVLVVRMLILSSQLFFFLMVVKTNEMLCCWISNLIIFDFIMTLLDTSSESMSTLEIELSDPHMYAPNYIDSYQKIISTIFRSFLRVALFGFYCHTLHVYTHILGSGSSFHIWTILCTAFTALVVFHAYFCLLLIIYICYW